MSGTWTKIVIAKLMIEECDHVLKSIDFDAKTAGQLHMDVWKARKAFWEKAEKEASLWYSLEGGS